MHNPKLTSTKSISSKRNVTLFPTNCTESDVSHGTLPPSQPHSLHSLNVIVRLCTTDTSSGRQLQCAFNKHPPFTLYFFVLSVNTITNNI
ncbi:hypothetical protein RIF29_21642 [Crotalaria pallida]|uniref:Uncharacterized protein n=1 Tax=Crotalaria pallida TaxID=3830 RepID=A0AAN9F3B2_CROPI